ncbi:MAG: YbaN family protein [Chlorobia bacterium]|nr:YbaN family protein [Fimbriimonadaceae bacterium]
MQADETRVNTMRLPFLLLGFTLVGLGYVGLIVPGMPSTIFFICAVWAFKRSSPRFESWLLNHPIFGPTLRDWDEHKAITMRTKVVAIGTMALFVGISVFLIHKPWVQLLVVATTLCVATYIATRKTKA